MDRLSALMQRIGIHPVDRSGVPNKNTPEKADPNEDGVWMRNLNMRDGQQNVTVQKMNVAVPGGILNPVVTYMDLHPVRPSLVTPADPRIPINAPPSPSNLDADYAARLLFLQNGEHPEYEKPAYPGM